MQIATIAASRPSRPRRESGFAGTAEDGTPKDGFGTALEVEGVVSLQSMLAATASDTVDRVFQENYYSNYQPRHCGVNIKRLLEDVHTRDPEAIKGARVLSFTNGGFSYFGLLRTCHARDKRFDAPHIGQRNFHHHVALEKDGRVFDLTYGIEPETPGVEHYIETMFLQDDVVDRERKLKDYKVQVIDAEEYLSADKDTSSTLTLGAFFQHSSSH